MKIDEVRTKVYRVDSLIKVLKLASLQLDRNDFADVLQEAIDINWEIHDFLEEMDSGNKVCSLTIVPKEPT